MRILKIFLAVCILLLLLNGCAKSETDKYYDHLDNINAIQITDRQLVELDSSNQDFILFIGRPTCQYCREFVPKLEKANEQNKRKIYYIDSKKHLNSYLSEFRSRNDIKIVPTLIRVKNKQVIAMTTKGSKTTVQEIKQILK